MPYLKKPKRKPARRISYEDRQQVYQSLRWKQLREAKLMSQPLCEVCLAEGRVTPAEDVHHIDSFLNYSGTLRLWKAFGYANLMSVCKECHGLIHSGKIELNAEFLQSIREKM